MVHDLIMCGDVPQTPVPFHINQKGFEMTKLQILKNRLQATSLREVVGKTLNLKGGKIGEQMSADGPYDSAILTTADGHSFYSASGSILDFIRNANEVFGGEEWDEEVPVTVVERTSQRGRNYLALVIE